MAGIELWLKVRGFQQEIKFHPERKWRFDWAHSEFKIAIEVEGGVWSGGRHTSGSGFIKDMEKYNAATVLGWKLLRYTPKQFQDGLQIGDIECLLNLKKN